MTSEGQGRKSTREFVQFIRNAEGSLAEVGTQILIAPEPKFAATGEGEGGQKKGEKKPEVENRQEYTILYDFVLQSNAIFT